MSLRGVIVFLSCFTLICFVTCAAPVRMAQADTKDRIIRVARKHLGTPYGTGPGQMTCTDFTRAVFKEATGRTLSRDVWGQKRQGYVPRQRKRGDLIIYKGHVAIWMGNGQIIHSSNYYGEVTISGHYWLRDDYVTTKRIR